MPRQPSCSVVSPSCSQQQSPVPSTTAMSPQPSPTTHKICSTQYCPYTQANKYQLSKNVHINYSLSGPSTGPLVVCLHGMSASMCQFTPLTERLNKYRFRVLRFDFWGHGLSSRGPRGALYTPEVFVDQLVDLLDHLELMTTPFSLVGFSMGGLVAVYTANQARFQINRVCLVSAAGLINDKPRRINVLLGRGSGVTIPLAKMAFMKCFIKRKQMEDGFFNPSKFPKEVDERYHRFRYNHRRNIETSLRVAKSMPFWENYIPYKQLAEKQKPVCLFYGSDDDISPPEEFSDFLRKTFGPSNLIIYRECKHLVLIEQFETAAEDILYFLLGGQPGNRRSTTSPSPFLQQPSPARVRPPNMTSSPRPENIDASYSVGTAGNKIVLQGGNNARSGGYANVRAVRM
eukprot:GHVS01105742.1.p1 GENE.GHVS01105742.1~~GHVS01105742.1.p1  ORF type:complete len:402 (+),score=33.55 GHVS01105742.1:177-1382(+)